MASTGISTMKPPEPTPDREMRRALHWMRRSGAESELLAEIAREVGRQRRRRWAGAGGGVIALGLLAGLWLRPGAIFPRAAVAPSRHATDLSHPSTTGSIRAHATAVGRAFLVGSAGAAGAAGSALPAGSAFGVTMAFQASNNRLNCL